MSKIKTTLAFAAMMAAGTPLAFAQTNAATAPAPTTSGATTGGTMSNSTHESMSKPAGTHESTASTAPTGDRAGTHESTASMAPTGDRIEPDQMRASKMIGSTVYDVQNRDIGNVKDLVLDHDGRVASVILDVGSFLGIGGKYVAVSLNDIKTDNNRLTLNRTKEQLKQAQEYHLVDRDTGAGATASPPKGGTLGTTTPVPPTHH